MVVGLRAQGLRLVVVKPTQTGLLAGEPGDLHDICRLAGEVETDELVRLPDPLAPDAAARQAGVTLPTVAEHAARLAEIAGRHHVDLVLVEGAGGLLVRIDAEAGTIADLGAELSAGGAKVGYVMVAAAGLGTLNPASSPPEHCAAAGWTVSASSSGPGPNTLTWRCGPTCGTWPRSPAPASWAESLPAPDG